MKIWYDVYHPDIKEHTLKVSKDGRVLDDNGEHNPSYLSSNGRLYENVKTPNNEFRLFPFDVIMAHTFIPVPSNLIDERLFVRHRNGILTDCHCDNLEWDKHVELWEDITYPDVRSNSYQVSTHGRVRSIIGDEPVIMKTDKDFYERINLATIGGYRKHFMVHRLVAFQFLYPGYGPDKQVNHINGNKFDNDVLNLEWVTPSQNTKHAYDTGLSVSPMTILSEADAVLICQSLNKNNGSLIDTFNELKHMMPQLTYAMVGSIKYGETFIRISDQLLTEAGRRKQIRQTDPDVILTAAQCLKKYNGDVKKTKKELETIFPWISYAWLWHLKDKSVASEITDLVFDKDEFPKTIPLTGNDAIMIIKSLMDHKDSMYVNQIVFDELKDKIPGLTKDKIRSIKDKKSWKNLSDKYFERSMFI